MSSSWQKTKLGEHVEVLTGFPFKSNFYTDSSDAIKLLRGDNIVQGNLRWDGVRRWPAVEAEQFTSYSLRLGDVVLAMDRPWIEAGLKYSRITEADLPCLLVQRVARLRAKEQLDQGFLHQLIGSREFTEHILSVQTGTAVPHISASQIKAFEFQLPSLPEQKAIARILSSLDDKIELNRRMNATLEALAQTLFRAWFVAFEPVKANAAGLQPVAMDAETAAIFPSEFETSTYGPIPKGWRISTIGDETHVVGGSTPSTHNADFWEEGKIHWATPKDLSRLSSPVLLDTERKITLPGLKQIGSGLLAEGTVLLSSRAPIGYIAIAEVPLAINQGFIAMECQSLLPNHYIRLWAEHNMEAIKSRANGTTFQEVSKTNFRSLPILVPSISALDAFQTLMKPIYSRTVANLRETQTLATLRDSLLPKLIAGQVRVPIS